MKLRHVICLAVVLVLVLKGSLRTFFKSLSLSWSLGARSLSLGGQVQEVLVLVLRGQALVLVLGGHVLVLVCQVLVLVGQVLFNIPVRSTRHLRSAEQGLLHVPFARTSTMQRRAFSVVGPLVWNGLLLALQSLPRAFSQKFLQQLKTTLFGRAGVGSASE